MLRIASLTIYPVKSLQGIAVSSLDLEPWGPRGDRRFMVVTPEGKFITQRTSPVMASISVALSEDTLQLTHSQMSPKNVTIPPEDATPRKVEVWSDHAVDAYDCGDDVADWLGACIRQDCRLVYLATPANARPKIFGSLSFADAYPLLITHSASLTDLNRRLENPIPMDRFRANIVLDGGEAWEEDHWGEIQFPYATIRIEKPCSRCSIPSVDQKTGHRLVPAEPLRTLVTFRRQKGGVIFGQNAAVLHTGAITLAEAAHIQRRDDTHSVNVAPAL